MDRLCVCWSSELILGGMGWMEARWALVLSPFYPGVTPGRWLQVTRVPQGLWLCLSRRLYHIPHFLPVGDEGVPSPPRSLGWFREPPGTMTPTFPSPWAVMAAGTLPVLSSELTESQNIPSWEGSIDPTHPW